MPYPLDVQKLKTTMLINGMTRNTMSQIAAGAINHPVGNPASRLNCFASPAVVGGVGCEPMRPPWCPLTTWSTISVT